MRRVRAMRLEPSAVLCPDHIWSVAGKSPSDASSASAEVHAFSAALAVPARRVRSHRKRGVPQEADPTDGHSGRLDVHNRLDERMFGDCDDRGDLVRQRSGGEFLEFAHIARS